MGWVLIRIARTVPHVASSAGGISVILARIAASFRLEPDDLIDQDDRDPAWIDLAVDDENFVHPAVDTVRRLSTRVLEGIDVPGDAGQALFDIGHDLLRAHDKDHPAGARGVRPKPSGIRSSTRRLASAALAALRTLNPFASRAAAARSTCTFAGRRPNFRAVDSSS